MSARSGCSCWCSRPSARCCTSARCCCSGSCRAVRPVPKRGRSASSYGPGTGCSGCGWRRSDIPALFATETVDFSTLMGKYTVRTGKQHADAPQMDRDVKPAAGAGTRPLFAYIDCVRGYAVVLVITCHVTGAFAQLPYPVHRLTTLGWHGVQLFFLASAVTLLMSWHHDQARFGRAQVAPFFIRRFFRIAPAYYAAAAFYA